MVYYNAEEFTIVCLLSPICHRFIVGSLTIYSHPGLKMFEIDQLRRQ